MFSLKLHLFTSMKFVFFCVNCQWMFSYFEWLLLVVLFWGRFKTIFILNSLGFSLNRTKEKEKENIVGFYWLRLKLTYGCVV